MSLNVPEVEAVSPEDLKNKACKSRDDRGQKHSGRVIFSVIGEETLGTSSNMHDQEEDREPENGGQVPGLDHAYPVENIKQNTDLSIREPPEDHLEERSKPCHNE